MSASTRFDPIARMLRAEPFRTFDEFFSDLRLPSSLRAADMAPRVRMDVSESEQAYKVMADLPGAKKEDIKVNIDGNQVSISAETSSQSEHEGATTICPERFWGQFYRSFTLPQAIDDTQAHAEFRDGVLELALPTKTGGNGKPLAFS
ncbi:Hsp20/alpha crystallin family protein [Massilia sp. S19_KUP03_FR1]|uniref:Hsp20/alpha crystallin family protein n=1 Tax=Massilia sp. S19_KUP03_FR1 TaxID=3025503 RepID=UPI002FCDC0C0